MMISSEAALKSTVIPDSATSNPSTHTRSGVFLTVNSALFTLPSHSYLTVVTQRGLH